MTEQPRITEEQLHMMSTRTLDSLLESGQIQRSAAQALSESSETLARVANGHREPTMPAPVVYDILAAMKITARNLGEVVEHLPGGMLASLGEPSLRVYGSPTSSPDFHLDSDPRSQIEAATVHLRSIAQALDRIAKEADRAQVAIAGQGFELVTSDPESEDA